jgi:hypothetical protein
VLNESYDLIIASHVWEDLGRLRVQNKVINKLLSRLKTKQSLLFVCHNQGSNFIKDLKYFAFQNLDEIRDDYYEDHLLIGKSFKRTTFETSVKYNSFEELARGCWFLFGTGNQDIGHVSNVFLPFLRKKLVKPEFVLTQEVYF